MRGVPLAADVSLAEVAQKTEGYSGADMAEICRQAKRLAIRRQLESGKDEDITAGDFAAAIGKVNISVNPEQIARFDKWRSSRARPPDADSDD